MQNRISFFPMALAICAFLFFLSCGKTQVAGGTSEQGNGRVTGNLVNGQGEPVKGAKVQMVPVRYNPLADLSLSLPNPAYTDSAGIYNIDSLPAGTFNLLADSGENLLAFRDSILVPNRSEAIQIPQDTLRPPGALHGVIRLQPGADSRTVFIIALGTPIFTMPENAPGNFILSGLAQGPYKVRIMTTLPNYGVVDTVIQIFAGIDTEWRDTLFLPYTGIPKPTGLVSEYDSLRQIVTLSWKAPSGGVPLTGYNIYRVNADSQTAPVLLNIQPVTDTAFRDSGGIQDQTYDYLVAGVDAQHAEGAPSVASRRTFTSAFSSKDTIVSANANLGAFAMDGNGNLYLAHPAEKQVAVYDSTGAWIRTWTVPGNMDQSQNGLYNNLQVGPDGNIYVYTYYDSIHVYNALGRRQRVIRATLGSCEGFAFRGDSLFVATEMSSRNIQIFRNSGIFRGTLNSNWDVYDNFYSLTNDSSGNLYLYGLLGTSATDRKNRIDVIYKNEMQAQPLHLVPTPPDGIMTLAQNRILICGSNRICSYDLSGNLLFRFMVPPLARKAQFSPDGNCLLVGFADGKIVRYSGFN